MSAKGTKKRKEAVQLVQVAQMPTQLTAFCIAVGKTKKDEYTAQAIVPVGFSRTFERILAVTLVASTAALSA